MKNIIVNKHFSRRVVLATLFAVTIAFSPRNAEADHIEANGLKMYYEVHGTGRPLVLLHGAFMSLDLAFGQLYPELAKTHKVIVVELQGHGRTANIDRPFSFEKMADDVAALLQHLKADSADIFGYSMGGGVALQLAIRHPGLVRKIVMASAVFKYEGWSAETRAVFPHVSPEMFEQTPLKTDYDRLAPDPKQWPVFINKMKKFITTPYDYLSQAASLNCPFLFIIGDSDGITPEHAGEMFRAAGGGVNADLGAVSRSQLAVLPATSHTGLMMQPDRLLALVLPFLDGAQDVTTMGIGK